MSPAEYDELKTKSARQLCCLDAVIEHEGGIPSVAESVADLTKRSARGDHPS